MVGVGVSELLLSTRWSSGASTRASYLAALAAGVDSCWAADHLNSLWPRSLATPKYVGAARLVSGPDAYLEAWTTLGYLAGRSRLRRRRLGIGVTDVARRNPAVTAQAAATLQLLTRGRAILGIGIGERESNEPYGVDWSTPVARFEEALATIRALWASGGELVTRDSPFFPLRNAVFGLPPYRGKWPEIWIGSHGPRMLRITGRQADGWLPAAIARPTHYATCLETVRSAASDAGRDPGSIIPACFRFVVTGRSRAEVDEVLDSPSVKAFALHLPATEWARHGARHPLGDDFAGYADLAPQTIDEQTALSYLSDVPPSLLEEGVFAGTPAAVIDQAAQWRDHGLRYAVVCNASALQPSLRRGLAASGAPFTKILRGLRRL